MDRHLLLGVFKDEENLLNATRVTRESGFVIHDVFTPYAVHGLDEAMGLRPSRLTYVCFFFALLGVGAAVYLQFWIGSIDWPLNVGGKPFNSFPAYLPVAFEITVLFAGLGVVFSMFIRNRIFPGKTARLIHHAVTDDRFVLALEAHDASFNLAGLEMIWKAHGVEEIVRLEDQTL